MKNPLEIAKRLKAMADTGLIYADNEYDKERYEELHVLSLELMSQVSAHDQADLSSLFLPVIDYPTPKTDVRAIVLNDQKQVLLVKEKADGKWALPGGWCEVGFTPSEVIEKEISEESGLEAKAIRLLAVYDKKCHPHPPQPHYVYKLFFLCETIGGSLSNAFDIEDVGYFSLDALPALSEERNVATQIMQAFRIATLNLPCHFD